MVDDEGAAPHAVVLGLESERGGQGERVDPSAARGEDKGLRAEAAQVRPDGEPGRGDGRRRAGHQRWTRETQSAGSAISAAEGNVSGEVHTALNPSRPTLSTTARTKVAPSAY